MQKEQSVPIVLDRQELGSTHIKFCRLCVVSNQRPRVVFDDEGICNPCRYSHAKQHGRIDWASREKELEDLCNRHRSPDGRYDVIVPSSGGKDSGYVAHLLKHKYGMSPLTVTWAPFLYTDIGWRNYLAFKDAGFDNLMMFPNGKMHRKLARTAFELLGDAWQPFTYGQKAYAFHIAQKFKIPLIFYGENGEVEYGGPDKNKDKPYESPSDWGYTYFKGTGIDELAQAGIEMGILTPDEVTPQMFSMYKAPELEHLEKQSVQMHWMSYYRKWIPQENYYYAAKHCGFQANPDGRTEGTYSKYASLDDKTDGFHFYLAYIKFGIGRCTADASHEVRDGHISREEAVSLVNRYDGEFPSLYFNEFLDYLGITEEKFWEVCDRYRKPHIWVKQCGEWKLRHTVAGDGVDDLAEKIQH
mgnify:CR=1 FL=1